MADHERIWLQHSDDAADAEGRMWCCDKVWPLDPEDGEPTEYVRADLLAEARAQIAAKDAALERRRLDIDHLDVKLADAMDQIAEYKTERSYVHGFNAGFEEAQEQLRAQIVNLQAMSQAKSDEIEHRDAQIAAKDAALVRLYKRLQKANRGGPLVVSFDPDLTDLQAALAAAKEE